MRTDIFMTVEIGTFKDAATLCKELLISNVVYLFDPGPIIQQMKLHKHKQSLDLVAFTIKELGLPQWTTVGDIYKAAKKRGLSLCPAEVGPQLRLKYRPENRNNHLLVVAMRPVKDSHGISRLFMLRSTLHLAELCLTDGSPDSPWYWRSGFETQFVFVRRK